MQNIKKHFDTIFDEVSRKQDQFLKVNIPNLKTPQIKKLYIFSNRIEVKEVLIKRSGSGLVVVAELKKDNKFIYLAKLGIVVSNDEQGNCKVQRIDNPQEFAEENELNFLPPLLKSDQEAKEIFKSLTHSQLENI